MLSSDGPILDRTVGLTLKRAQKLVVNAAKVVAMKISEQRNVACPHEVFAELLKNPESSCVLVQSHQRESALSAAAAANES